jgi:hypothetical protein
MPVPKEVASNLSLAHTVEANLFILQYQWRSSDTRDISGVT